MDKNPQLGVLKPLRIRAAPQRLPGFLNLMILTNGNKARKKQKNGCNKQLWLAEPGQKLLHKKQDFEKRKNKAGPI